MNLVLATIGTVLVALVAVQLLLLIGQTYQGLAWERVRRGREDVLWRERVEEAGSRRTRPWDGYRKFVVERKVPEADNVCSFYLVPHDGKPLPDFKPGQFLTFNLRIPGKARPVVRCYSLSDAPGNYNYRVTIKRVPAPTDQPDVLPGLVSNYFHDHCHEGDIIDVRAPGGKFFLEPSRDDPVVLIAGGVGITPFLSMVNALARVRSRREVWLFNGVRHGGEHVMRDHLRQLGDNVRVITCYSSPRARNDVPGEHYDHAGHVSIDVMKLYLSDNKYDFYMCGPPAMMDTITRQLEQWGVPPAHIHSETFGGPSVKVKKTTVAVPSADGPSAASPSSGSKVKFARSGKELVWQDEQENLVEFAEANGILLEAGCRAGHCGTCEVALVEGDVRYFQDPEFADLEDGCILPCICVPKTDVVIDETNH